MPQHTETQNPSPVSTKGERLKSCASSPLPTSSPKGIREGLGTGPTDTLIKQLNQGDVVTGCVEKIMVVYA
jgi:hypothetical protein